MLTIFAPMGLMFASIPQEVSAQFPWVGCKMQVFSMKTVVGNTYGKYEGKIMCWLSYQLFQAET